MATDLIAQYLRYAMPYAKKYNLDPYAMLAVAHAESGLNPGAIGDNGQSFGYHQFYTKGAGGPNARQYLDPRKNVERAAQLMSEAGASGLKGQRAIDAIVRRFERPANPSGEVQRALDFYKSIDQSKYGGGAGFSMSGPAEAAPVIPQGGVVDPLQQARDMTMQYLMSQNQRKESSDAQTTNLIELLRSQSASVAAVPQGVSGVGNGIPQSPQTGSTGSYNGLYPLGKKGKLIGTPYSGTHTIGNWQSDNAVDIGVPIGTPIVAVSDGVIGDRFGSLGKGGRFAGLRLNLLGSDNNYYYAHLSRFAAGIKPGTHVKKGQILGYSGSANGVAHLHFGVENGNPLSLFHLK